MGYPPVRVDNPRALARRLSLLPIKGFSFLENSDVCLFNLSLCMFSDLVAWWYRLKTYHNKRFVFLTLHGILWEGGSCCFLEDSDVRLFDLPLCSLGFFVACWYRLKVCHNRLFYISWCLLGGGGGVVTVFGRLRCSFLLSFIVFTVVCFGSLVV